MLATASICSRLYVRSGEASAPMCREHRSSLTHWWAKVCRTAQVAVRTRGWHCPQDGARSASEMSAVSAALSVAWIGRPARQSRRAGGARQRYARRFPRRETGRAGWFRIQMRPAVERGRQSQVGVVPATQDDGRLQTFRGGSDGCCVAKLVTGIKSGHRTHCSCDGAKYSESTLQPGRRERSDSYGAAARTRSTPWANPGTGLD